MSPVSLHHSWDAGMLQHPSPLPTLARKLFWLGSLSGTVSNITKAAQSTTTCNTGSVSSNHQGTHLKKLSITSRCSEFCKRGRMASAFTFNPFSKAVWNPRKGKQPWPPQPFLLRKMAQALRQKFSSFSYHPKSCTEKQNVFLKWEVFKNPWTNSCHMSHM